MTVTITDWRTPERRIKAEIGLAIRDAVNASAALVTEDARERLKLALGPEQRLSGYWYNPSGSRVKAAEGRRINAYYRKASSTYHPTALVAARGPAHLIEHGRRGGYEIRPRRKKLRSGMSSASAFIERMLGPSPAGEESSGHAPAIGRKGGDMFRGKVKGGFILRPQGGPFASAFRDAPALVARVSQQAIAQRLRGV